MMEHTIYERCVQALQNELIPAFGFTEPIAIAFAAAKAREVLQSLPEEVLVSCSANIIKNVKGVVVPATGHLIGIPAAAAIGIVGGKAEKGLEVLSDVTSAHIQAAAQLLAENRIKVTMLDSAAKLHIRVTMRSHTNTALVEIIHTHTNIVRIEKNGTILFSAPFEVQSDAVKKQLSGLSLDDLYAFAANENLDVVYPPLKQQISCNRQIAKEGLAHPYGAQIGRTLLQTYGDDHVEILAQAAAAAGSDARMGGCEMPVVINSGSGNQGMTVCIPLLVYAKHLQKEDDALYRALCLANLVAIFQRSKIGRLSAFCGVINASAGTAAGLTMLSGGTLEQIKAAIVNTLAAASGIICDGAKASCASKIALGVQSAILGTHMALDAHNFIDGQGLVKKTADASVDAIVCLARDGFCDLDHEILTLMMQP